MRKSVLESIGIPAFISLLFIVSLQYVNASNQGPMSPEAASFEPVDATDMVNLLTGDFSYVMPIMNVPGPEGGYPIALSYHAGITMDQAASWVGLGWNINPGAINRTISGYPDDWKNSEIRNIVYDAGGVESQYSLSIGVKISRIASVGTSFSWGSNRAFGGETYIGLGFGVGNGTNLGVKASIGTSGVGVGISASQNGIGVGAGVHSNGTGNVGVNLGAGYLQGSVGISFSSQGSSIGVSSGFGPSGRLSNPVKASDWSVVNTQYMFFPIDLGLFSFSFGSSTFEYWLFQERQKYASGTMYSEEARVQTPGSYSGHQSSQYSMDVYMDPYSPATSINANSNEINNCLMFPAYDKYSVNAQGLNGYMTPGLYERGLLVSGSRILSIDGNDKKTEITYNYNTNVFTKPIDNIYFNFSQAHNSFLKIASGDWYYSGTGGSDPIWDYSAYGGNVIDVTGGKSNYNQTTKRKGGAKYVEWFTNDDIVNNPTGVQARGFIESDDIGSRSDVDLFDPDGIGAFNITTPDGKTYHYSLPVYQYEHFYRDVNTANPGDRFFEQRNLSKYAFTWLLTAITGPDFVSPLTSVEDDYGYWVKFSYGKWTDGYVWRTPYGHSSYNDYVEGGVNKGVYQWGRKQIYYLNSIKTRSHTAYFVKSVREDGLGSDMVVDDNYIEDFTLPTGGKFPPDETWFNCSNNTVVQEGVWYYNYDINHIIDINIPEKHKVLKLDKIILVSNEDATLSTVNSTNLISNPSSSGGYMTFETKLEDITRFQAYVHEVHFMSALCSTPITKTFQIYLQDNVLDKEDILGTDIESKAIKIIEFDQDYSLCQNTINSTLGVSPHNKGKLTLNGVKIYGKGKADILPPYRFAYDNFGWYSRDEVDDWGYFIGSHNVGTINKDQLEKGHVDTWSLTEIITPVGARIHVDYESDSYKVEAANPDPIVGRLATNTPINLFEYTTSDSYKTFLTNPSQASSFDIGKSYIVALAYLDLAYYDGPFIGVLISKNISTGELLFSSPGYDDSGTSPGQQTTLLLQSFMFAQDVTGKFSGGGIRVKEIGLEDENGVVYKTKYDYNDPSTGRSSGVTSYSPREYQRTLGVYGPKEKRYIPYINELPGPGVMYEFVSVEQIGSDNRSNGKTLYHFEVMEPSLNPLAFNFKMGNHIEVVNDQHGIIGNSGVGSNHTGTIMARNSTVINNTAALGRLLEMIRKNNRGEVVQHIQNGYNASPELGTVQETFNYMKRYVRPVTSTNNTTSNWSLNSSSKKIYASELASVTSNVDGISSTISYNDFDFNTGIPLSTRFTTSLGIDLKSDNVQAYEKYPQMGSKVDNIANKNMLTQNTATYIYSSNDAGTNWNAVDVQVQTWNNEWIYRRHVQPSSFEDYSPTSSSRKIWRKYETYKWGGFVTSDGTFDNFQDFNWTGSIPQGWKKGVEITRYDHYSNPLESIGISGSYASSKMGLHNNNVIASAENSKYTEMTYSGAEDLSSISSWELGGEVYVGVLHQQNAENIGIEAHTGNHVLQLDQGQSGFAFNANINTEVEIGKPYRVSVWQHKNNIDIGSPARISVRTLPSGNFISQTDYTEGQQFGDWYLLHFSFVLPPASSTDVKVHIRVDNLSTGAPQRYFDDFRVHPVDAPMNSYVYDEKTGLLTAVLDNENIGTKFYYDDAGRLIRTEREFADRSSLEPGGFKKMNEHVYNYGTQ